MCFLLAAGAVAFGLRNAICERHAGLGWAGCTVLAVFSKSSFFFCCSGNIVPQVVITVKMDAGLAFQQALSVCQMGKHPPIPFAQVQP